MVGQVPQVPVPHPLSPHCLPLHDGVHWHLPDTHFHGSPVQVPHVPPHPSSPQFLPLQSRGQVQFPSALQDQSPTVGHVPHEPPQPSGPQFRPSHAVGHVHAPSLHTWSGAQPEPHVPPQEFWPQAWPRHRNALHCATQRVFQPGRMNPPSQQNAYCAQT